MCVCVCVCVCFGFGASKVGDMIGGDANCALTLQKYELWCKSGGLSDTARYLFVLSRFSFPTMAKLI